MENSVRNFLDKATSSNLNCFNEIFAEEAIHLAKSISEKKNKGKLSGMVFGIKDLFCFKDHESNASSKILSNYRSVYSSTVVERIQDEDGIIIGRQNCDEFGMGSTNENSSFGPVKNPLNPDYVSGGSSGGSAAAVAADLCNVSIGTDTGGSVRLPAAYCGVIGLKPTYGLIPRHGVISYASSFDTVGIIGNNIKEIQKTLKVIIGQDGNDSTALSDPTISENHKNKGEKPSKIAIFQEVFESDAVNKEVKNNFRDIKSRLEQDSHRVDLVSFDLLEYLLPTYYILTMAEASSNLSRYDGIRYGNSVSDQDLYQQYVSNRSEGFGEEVKRRILLGNLVLSSGYSNAFFTKAQRVRRLILNEVNELFKQYDYILLPTSPGPPPKIGELVSDPLKMYMGDVFTVLPSITGIPAISLPIGNFDNNLKQGVQCISKEYTELELLSFSQYLLN